MSNQISQRLKKLRERLNYSQEEFATPAGLQFHQISKYERGEVIPTPDALIRLSQAYHVNLHWVLTGDGEMFVQRKVSTSRSPNAEIASAHELYEIASELETAYHKYVDRSATAIWILNLVKSLSILIEKRKNVPRKRKLWRAADSSDTLMHDIGTYFPGEKTLDVMERIKGSIKSLASEERVAADYAWNVASCFQMVAYEFAFFEYTGKYKLSDQELKDISALLVPWCDWVAKTIQGNCRPLEVNPITLGISEKNIYEDVREFAIEESRDLVLMDAFTRKGNGILLCAFKFFQRKLVVPCTGVQLYSLIKAVDKLGDGKTGRVKIGIWDLFKDYDLPGFSVEKDGTRFYLNQDEFEQFIDLVKTLWDHPGVKETMVRNVLNDCGAL